MSSPLGGMEASAGRFRDVTDNAVDQAGDLARQTAQQMDKCEYGLNAATRSMSNFFDIIAKGSAAHFQTAIAGPCFNFGADEIPASEEEVAVTYVARLAQTDLDRQAVQGPGPAGGCHPESPRRPDSPRRAGEGGQVHLEGSPQGHGLLRQELHRKARPDPNDQHHGTLQVDYQVVTVAL